MKIIKIFYCFNNFVCLAIISTLITSCGGSDNDTSTTTTIKQQNKTSTMATRYFPLAIENTWQYFVSIIDTGGIVNTHYFYKNIDKTTTFNNADAYSVKSNLETLADENGNIYYSKWDEGMVYLGAIKNDLGGQGFTAKQTFSPQILLLKSSFTVGDSWSTTADRVAEKDGIVVQTEPFTTTFTVTAVEEVIVPAGIFPNTYKIREDYTSDIKSYTDIHWFAENVGIVKQEFRSGSHIVELQYALIDGVPVGVQN